MIRLHQNLFKYFSICICLYVSSCKHLPQFNNSQPAREQDIVEIDKIESIPLTDIINSQDFIKYYLYSKFDIYTSKDLKKLPNIILN